MATYVLIHGASSSGWYWHLMVPELEAAGHEVVATDLPCDDDTAGLDEYADAVLEAVGERRELIVVAQSLGGFTAPLVCVRRPVELIVLVAAMTPRPGETAGEWWTNTGHVFPDPFDPEVVFTHDLPPALAAEVARRVRAQSETPFAQPWPLPAWPEVPTRFLLCRDDRLFPAEFQRRVVKERLGIVPDEMDGGHLPALARPRELASRLESFRTNTTALRVRTAR
jgi:pimeloyl-ACP methyl ester carboxylesterase